MQKYAFDLFRLCLTLSIVTLGVKAAVNKNQIHEIICQFVMTLLFCSLIAAVIAHYQEWSWNIINGFKNIAGKIGSADLNSKGPLKIGYDMAVTILDKISVLSPGEALGFIICSIIVMIAFALMTAQIVFVKCEAMIAMNASVILLGLGGATFFKDYAINVMRYVLSVAFKLFVLQLLMGMGLQFIQELSLANAKFEDIMVVIGVSVVLLALVKSIPDVCSGIINGSHVSSGAALGQAVMATAVGSAAGAAMALGGPLSVARALEAVRKASQVANAAGATGMGKIGHMAGTLKSAHQEARADAGKLSHGERMVGSVNKRLQEMKMRDLGLSDSGLDAGGRARSGGKNDGGDNGQA